MRSSGYVGAGAIALWTGIVAVFMLLNGALDLEVYFVLWLIGLLAVTVLINSACLFVNALISSEVLMMKVQDS